MNLTIEYLKKLGKERNEESFSELLTYFKDREKYSSEIRREIISSIGRHKFDDQIYQFIIDNIYNENNLMDEVYQFFRTILYKSSNKKYYDLISEVLKYYNNEVLYDMYKYYTYKKNKTKKIRRKLIQGPLILEGDNRTTLKSLPDQSIQLIFTSPPYYNAREYTNYNSYSEYLNQMYETFLESYRILEDGRFIIINVSPVITKRPGREFTSRRYPIHLDFHQKLTEAGFTFIDEIIWIKPEASVRNRNGGIQQTRRPLMYKPNTITESILVYRKDVGFLLDENIKMYGTEDVISDSFTIESSNCWYIHPKSSKDHPAIFPDDLCEKILEYYSFKDDIVLDPFAGSGTFGRVALEKNRIPVLCENNQEYIDHIKSIIKKSRYN